MLTLVFSIREANDVIIYSRNTISDDKSTYESVCQPDEASHETYSIPNEELSEESEMGANDIPILTCEYQPVRSNKYPKARNNPGDKALDRRVESQKPRQYYLLKSNFVVGHKSYGEVKVKR
jgi:hypothetical protein